MDNETKNLLIEKVLEKRNDLSCIELCELVGLDSETELERIIVEYLHKLNEKQLIELL